MNTKTAALALAIAVSFAGVATAQDTTSSTTTTATTTAAPADETAPPSTTTAVTTTTTATPADSSTAPAAVTATTTTTTAEPTDQSAPAATTATTVTTTEETPAPAPALTSPMTELDVRNALTAQGYTKIHDVKLKEGVWNADAKSADGNHVELRVDAATGKIIPDEAVATIDKDAITAKLLAANYSDVHDVKFDDGVWKAEAKDSSGAEVDVKLDPNDGHILGSGKD